MPLHPSDPWYVPPSDPRYRRAQALSEMQRYIEATERAHGGIPPYRADTVARRRHCLENWEDYLNGKIDMLKGRKPVVEEERFAKVHITLPPGLYRRVLALRRDGESESALIARLLDGHPEIMRSNDMITKTSYIGSEGAAFERLTMTFTAMGYRAPQPEFDGAPGNYLTNIASQYQTDLSEDEVLAVANFARGHSRADIRALLTDLPPRQAEDYVLGRR